MSENHKKVSRALDFLKHFLVFVSVIGSVSLFTIASLVAISLGISSSAVGLIGAITAGIKKYASVLRKRRKIMIK